MHELLFCLPFAAGLTLQPNESVLGSPAMDNIGERAGPIRRVSFSGSDWGTNPYPLTKLDADPFNDASPSQGDFFTDNSPNGWRIRKSLLDMHNYVRKLEAPAAKYMTKLIWDFHLEAYSRQWAQYLCSNPQGSFFDHSPDNQSGIPAWPYRISTGENLYTSTMARSPNEDFSDVVTKWYAERSDFNWSTGQSNDPSKPIGHWKQLVRPQATAVGCSVIGNCHAHAGSGAWKTYVICHYDYGNIGTLPYEPGTGETGLCQSCPTGFSCCEAGLCTGRSDSTSTSLAPYAPADQRTEDWYGCATFKRNSCENTGAAGFHEVIPDDSSSIEFQQCHCGNDPLDYQDVVDHAYFYFRNQCYQGTDGEADDNSNVNSIYAMAKVKSKSKGKETTLDSVKKGTKKVAHGITNAAKTAGKLAEKGGKAVWGATKFIGGTAVDVTKNIGQAATGTAKDIKERIYVDGGKHPSIEPKRADSKAPGTANWDLTHQFKESIKPLHLAVKKPSESGHVDVDVESAQNVKFEMDQEDDTKTFKMSVHDTKTEDGVTTTRNIVKHVTSSGGTNLPPSIAGNADVNELQPAEPPKKYNEALAPLKIKPPPSAKEPKLAAAAPPSSVNPALLKSRSRITMESP